jgi:outer membrane protein OmpA-like peptidoglycan-associated protein
MKQKLAFGAAIIAFLLVIAAMWLTANRISDLNSRLEAENQRSNSMQAELQEKQKALETVVEQARLAREDATRAASAAEQLADARDQERDRAEQAQTEAQDARGAAERARLAAEEAAQREHQSRAELAALHERRKAELDRMQQALNKIAPTRRTATGMVIDLADESFGFDFDSASLRQENREILSRIAGILLASEGYRLFVYGHTDDTGDEGYNQQLSERRATSVSQYLQKAGVPGDLMEVKGFGKSSPRAANATRAGRQKNRRVEIGIVDSIIEYGDVVEGQEM